jgi:hypothetical protein
VGPTTLWMMISATLIGLFLPTPMAFDLILVNALMTENSNPAILMILLCSLGIFSCYSYIIVAQGTSHKLALRLAGGLAALCLIFGGVAHGMKVFKENQVKEKQILYSETNDLANCHGNEDSCNKMNSIFKLVAFSTDIPELHQQWEVLENGPYLLKQTKIKNTKPEMEDYFYLGLDKNFTGKILGDNNEYYKTTVLIKYKNNKGQHIHIFSRFRNTKIKLPSNVDIQELIFKFDSKEISFQGPFKRSSFYQLDLKN